MMSMHNYMPEMNNYYSELKNVIDNLDRDEINKSMNAIYDAYQAEKTIYVFGNGGSAATASHMMNDFNKGISTGLKKKFRFQCLNDNVATLMAVANDIGYEDVFVNQLENRLNGSELVLAISGSGNSRNVTKAVEYAKSCGCKIIGLTGYKGGRLDILADYHMHVNVDDMQLTEDVHMTFDHMMMRLFCNQLGASGH